MLHALLHGKLDPTVAEPNRLEDALTSTVFGTLAIVDAWGLIEDWLGVPASSTPAREEHECWFWPRLAGGVEPDVILRIGNTLVVVEAKYRSGRHDLSLDEDEERPADQIVRQCRAVSPPHDSRSAYPDLLERAVRDCELVQTFVVDARRMRRARRERDESLALLPAGSTLRLVTWQELYRLLEAGHSATRWGVALMSYLRSCGLASFRGIRRNLAGASDLESLADWRPLPLDPIAPAIRASGALLAQPTINTLRLWRPSDNGGGN